MSTLNLGIKSPRTKVFRALEQVLRADPVFSSAVTDSHFRTWRGRPEDAAEFTQAMSPAVRMTPSHGPEEWKFPEAFKGWLFIRVDLLVKGYDADDVMNLWWAIERAFYPTNDLAKAAIIQSLQAAGAYTGLVYFSQPAFEDFPESNFWAASGQLKIEVLSQVNV